MTSEAKKRWNESNKEHIKEYQRKYYLAHRDSILAKVKKYQLINREHKKSYLKAYHIVNADKAKVQSKAYRRKNKEKIKAWKKAYYITNGERLKREDKTYRINHKEQVKKYMKVYNSTHLEQRRMANRKREALKLGNNHERYIDAHIFERDNWMCGICGQKINKRLKNPNPRSKSIDHIIPLTKGGADSPINLQAAHLQCNIGKGAKNIGQLRLVN